MIYNHAKIITKLSLDLANYILDDREREDYLDHCSENDLQFNDFLNNASIEGGHVYAKAMALIFHIEQKEQSDYENEFQKKRGA